MPLKSLPSRLATLPRRVSRTGTPSGQRIRGRALQRIRNQVLSERPLCVICDAAGLFTIATVVDHIVALENGGRDDPSNRQPLCYACHDDKNRADNARRRGGL